MYKKIAVISRSGFGMYTVRPGQRTNGSGLSDCGGVKVIAWGKMFSK